MREWQEYKFSDFVEINPKVSLKGNEDYSFVEMKDLQDGNKFCFPKVERKTSSGARFAEGDTLFARITPCLENGKICQVRGLKNGIGFGSTEFLVFRGKEGVSDTEFVFYLSRWNEVRDFAENNFEGTSGRQRVPKTCFDNLFLELPALSEQAIIADALGNLDKKIDILHRQNTTIEQLAETLFRQLFSIDGNKLVSLEKYVDCINGYSYKSSELNPSENALVTLKNFDRNGGFRLDGFKEFTGKVKETQIVEEGDLVVAHTDITQEAEVIGNPVLIIADPNYEVMVITMDLVKVLPKFEWLSKEFLYFLMRSREFKYHCLGCSNGTTVLHLSKKAIPTFEFQEPDKATIEQFTAQARPLIQKVFSNHRQIKTLTQLRENLLPKLMSGEIKIETI